MAQEQESTKDITQSNPQNRLSPMFIFQDKHWSYIQRRYWMSPRELEIAELVCRGLSNDQIAKDLVISGGTVKTHVRNIYRKIRVNNKLMMLLKFIGAANHLETDPPAAKPVGELQRPCPKHSRPLGPYRPQ